MLFHQKIMHFVSSLGKVHILKSRKTINKFGKNTTISVKGRHDPCVGIRAVPVGEAMINCVLLDHYLMHKAQCS